MPNGRPRRQPSPLLLERFPDAKEVAAGIFRAAGDTAVIDARQLLEANGYQATPENLAALERAAREVAADRGLPYELDDRR